MQIVIDIPDFIYNALKEDVDCGTVNLNQAIASGTVLPKGHGDLIDRDYFTDKYAGCGNVYCEAISCKDCNSRIVNKFDVDSAPAVIEADK